MNGLGIVQVFLPAALIFVSSLTVQRHIDSQSQGIKRFRMERRVIRGDLLDSDPAHTAYRVCEIPVDKILLQSDRLKDLCSLVRLDRRNTHFGCDLYNSMDHRVVVIVYRRIVVFVQQSGFDQLADGLMGKIRVDRAGPVSQQSCKMVYLSWLSALQDHSHRCSFLCTHQMLLQAGDSQKRRDRHMVFIHLPVRQDQNVCPFPDCPVCFDKYILDRLLQAGIFIVCDRNLGDLEAFHIHFFDLQQIRIGKNRVVYPQHFTVFFPFLQQVSVPTYINRSRSYDLLADRVDGRICNLGKQLFKVAEQGLLLLRKDRKRHVDSHCPDSLASIFRHRKNGSFHILIGVAESLLQPGALLFRIFRNILVRNLQVFKMDQISVEPLAVGFFVGVFFFQLLVIDHPSRHCIHEQHLARMQPFFYKDFGRLDIKHAYL